MLPVVEPQKAVPDFSSEPQPPPLVLHQKLEGGVVPWTLESQPISVSIPMTSSQGLEGTSQM
ncbi:hypothetical protein EAY42_28905, partial [Vibrio anguillarum]|nr:hypothetical protein [Vibrio anguillarum]